MKILKYGYLLFLSLIWINPCYSNHNESITLTSQMLKSQEACPTRTKYSASLNCKAYHQTTGYTCGPAAVMALMNYYGKLSNKEMNQKTELRIANEMGATSDGATSSQLVSWLSNHGFSVQSGQGVTTDFLISKINSRKPIIVEVYGHWILAKGYNKQNDQENDEIIFADSCCSITIMYRKTIDSLTQESQSPHSHCSQSSGTYIEAVPS